MRAIHLVVVPLALAVGCGSGDSPEKPKTGSGDVAAKPVDAPTPQPAAADPLGGAIAEELEFDGLKPLGPSEKLEMGESTPNKWNRDSKYMVIQPLTLKPSRCYTVVASAPAEMKLVIFATGGDNFLLSKDSKLQTKGVLGVEFCAPGNARRKMMFQADEPGTVAYRIFAGPKRI